MNTKDDLPPFSYLEIGAYNGIDESNTRFFDVCLGWNGLLVEANPMESIWEALVENRPTAHRMHFAASCSHETARTATVPFYKVLWTNAAQVHDEVPSGYQNVSKPKVDMPCGSLTPFIQDLLGGRVTFMSLDVEGAEPLILEQMDFTQIMVDVMIVEVFNQNCPQKGECKSRDQFRQLLKQAGYVRPVQHQFIHKSDLFFHPDSPFLKFIGGAF